MTTFSAWLIEVFKRFGLTTPRFFQVWQTIGIIALGIGFIPDALVWLELTPNEIVSKYISLAVKVAGGVTWLMAKMPVTSNNRPQKDGAIVNREQALPYTANKGA